MKRILFVCHGNICRSPMAEYVMRDLVQKEGLDGDFEIASAATSTEEIGNGVYPPVRRLLNAAGIDCSRHHARQMTARDYKYYDMVICMDRWNLRNLSYIIGNDDEQKVSLLLSYVGDDGDVADPWYTRDFDLTWRQVNDSCKALLKQLRED